MNRSFLLLALLTLLPTTKSEFNYATHSCSNTTTYASNSSYGSDLRTLLGNLSNSLESYFNNGSTKTREKIEALYQCRNDMSLAECKACVANATSNVLKLCPNEKTAVIWYDKCLLRYSNETIVSVLSLSPTWFLKNTQTVLDSERALFAGFVRTDLNDCATEAANSPFKIAVRERNTNFNLSITDRIYSLVQCTEDLSDADCSSCLQDALGSFSSCCSSTIGARVLKPSCNFRFEINAFYNASGIPLALPPAAPPSNSPNEFVTGIPSPGKSGLSTAAIIAISVSIGVVSVIFFAGCFVFVSRRGRTNNFEDTNFGSKRGESLEYNLNTLKAATNNFSEQNLLGRGGYGDVFKGTLENGQEIAVKRLAVNSCQGETEFKNEASLVANLQHRNLTRLLGFCLEGEERILIYECVPNKSLDLFLFDREGGRSLEWAQRYKIINGVARGMLYLHEESRLKIIHRDLKASNILLDGFFNPKISDFGMARIFNVEETRASTHRIVGTYGYMAPEYAMHGKFSAKSDVYSFGVLVLEIITGLKATEFYASDEDGYGDLISFVWDHWVDKTMTEAVDKSMKESYSKQEVLRCVHVALLCVEESPMDRPTMATVVLMLNSESTTVTLPKQPSFNHISSSKFSELKSRASYVQSDVSEVHTR